MRTRGGPPRCEALSECTRRASIKSSIACKKPGAGARAPESQHVVGRPRHSCARAVACVLAAQPRIAVVPGFQGVHVVVLRRKTGAASEDHERTWSPAQTWPNSRRTFSREWFGLRRCWLDLSCSTTFKPTSTNSCPTLTNLWPVLRKAGRRRPERSLLVHGPGGQAGAPNTERGGSAWSPPLRQLLPGAWRMCICPGSRRFCALGSRRLVARARLSVACGVGGAHCVGARSRQLRCPLHRVHGSAEDPCHVSGPLFWPRCRESSMLAPQHSKLGAEVDGQVHSGQHVRQHYVQ